MAASGEKFSGVRMTMPGLSAGFALSKRVRQRLAGDQDRPGVIGQAAG